MEYFAQILSADGATVAREIVIPAAWTQKDLDAFIALTPHKGSPTAMNGTTLCGIGTKVDAVTKEPVKSAPLVIQDLPIVPGSTLA